MNGSANPGLLEHDIALDRRRRLIFARLDDAVVRRRCSGLNTSKITTGSRTTLSGPDQDRSKSTIPSG